MTLTLVLTEECNGNCIYCPQRRSSARMSAELAFMSIERILPNLDSGGSLRIDFYGGEPLLEREIIKDLMHYSSGSGINRTIHYAMTTNGALLEHSFLETVSSFPFDLTISHDGLWQRETRAGIPPEMTLEHFEMLLARHPDVKVQYNCVCPPAQVSRLCDNIRYFREETERMVHFALDSISPWHDTSLAALDTELSHIRQAGLHQACPSFFDAPKPGMFACSSSERITIDPQGGIWGCHQYYDLFNRHPTAADITRHRVGHICMRDEEIKELVTRWPICQLYEQQQFMAGDEACLLCDQFTSCSQCPVNGAYSTGEIGRLPAWICRIQRILQKNRV